MQQGGPSSSFLMSPTPYWARSRGSSFVRSSASKTRRELRMSKALLGEAVHPRAWPRHRSKPAAKLVELDPAVTAGRERSGVIDLLVEAQSGGAAADLRTRLSAGFGSVRNGVNGACAVPR